MDERLEKFLQLVVNEGASDLHLTVGVPPTLRVAGSLSPITSFPVLSSEDTRELVFSLLSEEQRERLMVNRELDFSFTFKDSARLRVNAYFRMGGIAAALRRIPLEVPKLSELRLPEILNDICELPQGFVLVTGPTGSGKSTTIAAMIGQILQTRPVHVVTIEDPIEYVFEHSLGLINQREMHTDTLSWSVALKSVLREDPDVVFVGEMRDFEAIAAATTVAETGHLVLSTLHTNSAAQSVDRIVDVFPEEQQQQIRTQLASTLEAIISQRLVPAIGGGRVPACEILLSTPAVRNVIREGNTHQVDNIITTSLEQGMFSLERDLVRLVREGFVELDDARKQTLKIEEFERLLR